MSSNPELDSALNKLLIPENKEKFLEWMNEEYVKLQARNKRYAIWYDAILTYFNTFFGSNLDLKAKTNALLAKDILFFFEKQDIPWALEHHGFLPRDKKSKIDELVILDRVEFLAWLDSIFAEKNKFNVRLKGLATNTIIKLLNPCFSATGPLINKLSDLFLKENIPWKFEHNVGWIKISSVSAIQPEVKSFIADFTGTKMTESKEEIIEAQKEEIVENKIEEQKPKSVAELVAFLEQKYIEINKNSSRLRGVSTNDILNFCGTPSKRSSYLAKATLDLRILFSEKNIDWEYQGGCGWLSRYEVKLNTKSKEIIEEIAPRKIETVTEQLQPADKQAQVTPQTIVEPKIYGKTKSELIEFLENTCKLKTENSNKIPSIPAFDICSWLGFVNLKTSEIHSYRTAIKNFMFREQIPWETGSRGFVPVDEEFIASLNLSSPSEKITKQEVSSAEIESLVDEMEAQTPNLELNLTNLNSQNEKIKSIVLLTQNTMQQALQAGIAGIRAVVDL